MEAAAAFLFSWLGSAAYLGAAQGHVLPVAQSPTPGGARWQTHPTALLPCQAPGSCIASAIPGHNQLLLLPHQVMHPLQMGSAGRKFVFFHMPCHVFEKMRTRIPGHSPTKSGCRVFYLKLLL